jgi:hypothetical protein
MQAGALSCAEGHFHSLAYVVCCNGMGVCVLWIRIAKQCLNCALVRGRGIVFRQYCKSIA